MEEVRQLVQEEGREARNLVAFHVSVESSAPRVSRKPPRLLPSARRAPPRPARLRSASAGRDKRSELRARYWALLFGDLQRAIGEIYNTVEVHENLSECQEVILVLENYTRDFKALCEWFRLKWEYDNTPPPQRPQSLAWEIRKTDFVRPESRKAHSVRSSPSVSGKNSPCLSGHNTPSGKNSPNLLTGKTSPGSGKISPRISSHSITSPKSNIEFFSNKIASKVMAKPEPKSAKDLARLSDIKEKIVDDVSVKDVAQDESKPDNESTTDGDISTDQTPKTKKTVESLSVQAKATINQLNVMECAFLEKQLIENAIKNDNILNQDREREVKEQLDKYPINDLETESPTKSEENFADVSSGSSKSVDDLKENDANDHPDAVTVTKKDDSENITKVDIQDSQKKDDPEITSSIEQEHAKKEKSEVKVEVKPTRPAYSQAAAKPKLVTTTTKVESKPVSKTASLPLTRSKTVVEIRSMGPKPQRPFPKRNQTVKCSYPFNLTTGRTSLFEPNKQASKRPLKPNQTGSGDNKTKIDPKKLPFKRPTTLKLNENGDKKEKTQLEKIKDCEEYSSSETVVTQIDMSRIESSESLKTLIAEDREFAQDVANSIEVLNIDGNKNDNEGWLTVKSRRLSREYKKQSKSHWSNRFHQPSATTSLPTLNMIESPKQETKPIISTPPHPKLDRAKSEQPQSERKVEKTVKVVVNTKPNKDRSKNTSMIRQKSDVTGLKSRSARNKALSKKSEKNRERKNSDLSDLTKNRLHSSLESLTGLSRSQESTEEPFDFDKWKAEFKSTFKYLDEDDQMTDHNDILKDADPSEMSEIAEMTSQIEENERKISLALDFQCEVDQRKLSEEEDLLNRQIMELQQVSDVDLDTETDDTETDLELASPPLPLPTAPVGCCGTTTLEDQYEAVLEGMSWAERIDTLQQLEQLVSRHPGRAQQLHAKLSQGIKRRGSFQDALRRLQAKQARAEQQRQDLQTERTKKIHMLLTRVEEVKVAKNQLIEDKRLRMERRLQKAAENRDQHLKDIVRKAHDEEEKLREIAFIKQLEAENRRHEFLEQCRSHTGRLRVLRRERLEKLKQKADREMAVGLRRQALEQARLIHVENLLERRKLRDQRVQERRGQRQLERDHAAREKAEGVRSRLSALAAAAAREARLLRRRIHDKQRASQLRLHSHLQAVRARAARHQTTSESNENENLPADEEEVIDQITQEKKERDRLKAMKKRARKLRQKLLTAGQEYEDIHYQDANPISSNNKVGKILNQINTIVTTIQQSETKPQQNGIDKDGNKNKNMNDNLQKHLTNGEVTETKKSKKKKGSSVEKQLNNTDKIIENNVDNTESSKENIIDSTTVNTVPTKTKSKKKKNKEPSPENDNDKNRNDKQKNGNDKMKLVKSPSIASSMSDMSKVSCKSDKKMPANIDWTYFEKIMNELNRAIEKVDKSAQETLLHGIKILVQLLGLAVDREEYSLQVTSKCLSTLMTVLSRVMSIDASAALEFVNSNGCVHAVKLLSTQLDKDLESDKTEQSLTTQTCLCVGQALEVVLQSTRAYEDIRETGVDKKVPSLASHRQRAHCIVNYLCISGCLSHSDLCNAVKDNIHSLITVCANLCRPCDVDTGQDRTTAISSLRTSMAYELGGARSDFCSLFEEVEVEDASVARTTRLLRALAELDHTLVQEAFGEGHWLLEFRAAVARLLSLHAPTDREPPRNNSKQGEPAITQSEEIVVDIIVLIGLVVVNNAAHQEVLCEGWSAIKILCNLPARWLVWSHRGALLPALAALAQHPPAAAVIQAEMSPQMIEDYITSPEASNVRLVQILKEGQKKSHKK